MDTIDQVRKNEENLLFVYRGVTSENSVPLLLLLERDKAEFSYLGRKRLFMFVLEVFRT